MNDIIEAKVNNTLAHFQEANLWHKRYHVGKARRIFAWSCLAVVFLLGLLALKYEPKLRLIGIWAVIFPSFMLLQALVITPRKLRNIFAEMKSQGCEVTWRFGEETIEVSSPQGGSSFRWDSFVRAGVASCGVSLFPQKNMSHWIPASAFVSPEDFGRFVELVKSRVPKTKVMR